MYKGFTRPCYKAAKYPFCLGDIDPLYKRQQSSEQERHLYLPLSASTAGELSSGARAKLADVARERGFKSQFWLSRQQCERRWGGIILPDELHRGVEIGLGGGLPLQVHNIDDIEQSDLQLFLRTFPIPRGGSTRISIFDSEADVAQTLSSYPTTSSFASSFGPAFSQFHHQHQSYQQHQNFQQQNHHQQNFHQQQQQQQQLYTQHQIFDGLKWKRFKAMELNIALDQLLKTHPDYAENIHVTSCWIFADIVQSRQLSVLDGRKSKHAMQALHQKNNNNKKNQQQFPSKPPVNAPAGSNWAELWQATQQAAASQQEEEEQNEGNQQQQNQQNQQEEENKNNSNNNDDGDNSVQSYSTSLHGSVLFNVEQTNIQQDVEDYWQDHLPQEDVSIGFENARRRRQHFVGGGGGFDSNQQQKRELADQQNQESSSSASVRSFGFFSEFSAIGGGNKHFVGVGGGNEVQMKQHQDQLQQPPPQQQLQPQEQPKVQQQHHHQHEHQHQQQQPLQPQEQPKVQHQHHHHQHEHQHQQHQSNNNNNNNNNMQEPQQYQQQTQQPVLDDRQQLQQQFIEKAAASFWDNTSLVPPPTKNNQQQQQTNSFNTNNQAQHNVPQNQQPQQQLRAMKPLSDQVRREVLSSSASSSGFLPPSNNNNNKKLVRPKFSLEEDFSW